MQTYSELLIKVADTLSRSDLDVAHFVKLTEAEIATRTAARALEATSTVEVTNGNAELSDFRSILSVKTEDGQSLNNVGAVQADRLSGSEPQGYFIIGNAIRVAPPWTGSVTVTHTTYLPNLVNANDTNEVLTRHPAVYLYGACHHATVVTQDTELFPLYERLYEKAMALFENDLLRWKYGGVIQRIPG